ncbi:Cwf15/Cwc15 cell cycle control protein [Terfezia boudieri ATCC MYA-4762]|uniref:Cwf15/Cwc15 cell cycle control protein n=1 Tax=Terfezia boudieri ATCC MYA-4762 TaxID=1051890 RepID=A0A3N4LM98_9PEZI|nr:Cwf15/Cwc15 cell cycle control protein [Terfezia boudieri ATCC MYA-4762]RPB24057.1 Cwf15/Cwc15 cell cycle control protein [Terfezia boudieri ATCC MYA-4762]
MTTAHRPTFDPARGKEIQKGPAYHQRLLPAYTKLKVRQPGQGGDADKAYRDLRAELLAAEAAHYANVKGIKAEDRDDGGDGEIGGVKGQLEAKRNSGEVGDEDTDDLETNRRKILAETHELDADSDGDGGSDVDDDVGDDVDDDDDDDSEDDEEILLRELEKIKKERADQRERQEREKAVAEEAKREVDIARGNPLLNSNAFAVKRRWDDDVIFKNQARGTDERGIKKEFVNDLLRSDFHKKFMSKYVR